MLGRLLILGGLLLASPVSATPIFWTGFEIVTDNTETQFWDAIVGSPDLTGSGDSSSAAGLEITATTGSAEYVAQTITSASTLSATARVRFNNVPGTRRRILSFRSTDGGGKDGCMVTAEPDPVDPYRYRLKVFYESSDTTGGECSASATEDGTECTADSDCDEINVGEAQCLPGVFASSRALATGTWYGIGLQQTNGTGEVTCAFWHGAGGTSPVVYALGSQTRDQGSCSGGTNPGKACDGVSNTCPGGGSCTTTDVVTIEEVRFGTGDTDTGSFTYLLDDVVIDDGAPNPNVRIAALAPTSDNSSIRNWSVDGCTSGSAEYDCINDLTGDGDVSYVFTSTDDEAQEANVTDITLAVGESVLGVSVVAMARDDASSSAELKLGVSTTDGTTVGSAYNLNTISTNTYHQPPPVMLTDPPGAPTSWTETLVDGLYLRLQAGTGTFVRVTQALVEVLIDQADPTVPAVLPDRNQDGMDTFCFVGDSTFNDALMADLIVAGVIEAQNILECARGGATAGDLAENISSAGTSNDILDGDTNGFMACRALKGVEAPCDVLVLEIGVNTLHTDIMADPTNATTEHGVSGRPPGFCDQKGGGNDQGACVCPNGTGWRRSDTSNGATRYCRVKGANWLATCETADDCTVASAAECCTDCADTSCATCTNTASSTLIGGTYCGCSGAFGCVDATASGSATGINTMCVAGCLDSPQCPGGLCMDHENVADVMNELGVIEAARVARPTPTATPPLGGAPLIAYAAPPPGQIKSGLGGWQDIEREVGNLRTSMLVRAKATGQNFIDMYGWFLRDSPGGKIAGTSCATDGCTWDGASCYYDRGCSLRDLIHWNEIGQTIAANAIIACATNANGEEAPGTRTSDGTCAAGTCTTGRVNDPCSVNADCALWRCDWGIP